MENTADRSILRLPWIIHVAAFFYAFPPLLGIGILIKDQYPWDLWFTSLFFLPTAVLAVISTIAIYSRRKIGIQFAVVLAVCFLFLNFMMPGIYGGLAVEAAQHGWPSDVVKWVTAAVNVPSISCIGAVLLLFSPPVHDGLTPSARTK